MNSDIVVLIADDEQAVNTVLRRQIQALGFATLSAYSLHDVLQVQDQANVLFLDWKLNGGQITADVALDAWIENRRGPVCVFSGVVTKDDEDKWLQRGASNVLQKPFGRGVLESLLTRYAKNVRAIQACKEQADQIKLLKLALAGALGLSLGKEIVPLISHLLGGP